MRRARRKVQINGILRWNDAISIAKSLGCKIEQQNRTDHVRITPPKWVIDRSNDKGSTPYLTIKKCGNGRKDAPMKFVQMLRVMTGQAERW